jgi:hypothetical protein
MRVSKRPFVATAMAMACALLSSAPNASAGTAGGVTITRLHISSGNSTIVGVKLSAAITSPDPSSGSCTGRDTSTITFDSSTDPGKLLLSQLTAALLAGKAINFYGTAGTACLQDPSGAVGEEIDLVFIIS